MAGQGASLRTRASAPQKADRNPAIPLPSNKLLEKFEVNFASGNGAMQAAITATSGETRIMEANRYMPVTLVIIPDVPVLHAASR